MSKTKNQIYEEYLQIPYEDGTKEELYEVYKAHPQTDVDVLQRACESMSDYIWVCMNCWVSYWNTKSQEYQQNIWDDMSDYDLTKWKIEFLSGDFQSKNDIAIYPDNFQSDGNLFEVDHVEESDVLDWLLGDQGYESIFNDLLNGYYEKEGAE